MSHVQFSRLTPLANPQFIRLALLVGVLLLSLVAPQVAHANPNGGGG